MATPSTPQATGIEWQKVPRVEIPSPEWIILLLEMVKGLLPSQPSNQQAHFGHKALRARLLLDIVRCHPDLYEHIWLGPFCQYCESVLRGEELLEG